MSELPWQDAYPGDVDWRTPIAVRPLPEVFEAAVREHGARTCIHFLGLEYSYEEVGDLVRRATRGLRRLGVAKGVRVGLLLPNTPYYVVMFHAILAAGGTVVNLNPLYAEEQIAELVEKSATKILVTLDVAQLWTKAAAAHDATALERIVVCRMTGILPFVQRILFPIFKSGELARVPAEAAHVVEYDALIEDGEDESGDEALAAVTFDAHRDVAVLQFTGGTTGTPKAAMLSHANVTANTEQVWRIAPGLREGEERVLGLLPLCHVFAMTVVMNLAIRTGSMLILLPRFDLDQILKVIARQKPTVFPGVPAVYAAINGSPKVQRYDLSSIRFCISGGSALPPDVKEQFEANTGCQLVEGYGLSESSPVATCNMFHGVRKEKSIGIPIPATLVEIRSVDDREKPMPTGEWGEICVKGPQVMLGYLDRPDATAEVLVDGWLHTGDVGYMDEDGFVFLVDRIKDVIVRDGYKAYPRLIEEAIRRHPAVADVSVVGVPDPQRGEVPKAFIRLVKGESLTADELHQFLKPILSPIEMPKEVEFRARLPRTLVGKPSKQALRDE